LIAPLGGGRVAGFRRGHHQSDLFNVIFFRLTLSYMREEAKFIAVASEGCQFIELTIDIEHDRAGILYARVHFSGHLTG